MALKFVQTGYAGGTGSGGGTYDHNLMINRGLPDQHTIESVTGLRTALNKKYEKPFSGIPKTDLAFDVATIRDIDMFRKTDVADLNSQITSIATEIQHARGGLDNLKAYIDTKVSYSEWSGGGTAIGGGGHIESQVGYPLYEEYRATEGQTTFVLGKTYRVGTRQLEVHLNGLRMVQDDDYKELNDHTVEFLFPLNQGDLVVFTVRAVINSGLHEEYVAADNQTVFTLGSPYGINQNILQVYRNGNLLRKGRDYREIDSYTIEFVYPLNVDDYITFHQAGATDPLAGTIMESEIGRVKINLGYTTMDLQKMSASTNVDYVDMYVDNFITDQNIDKEKSFVYSYDVSKITVTDIDHTFNTQDDFKKGVTTDTDILTFPDEVILHNLQGGAEAHNFDPFNPLLSSTTHVADFFMIYNNKHQHYMIYSDDVGAERILQIRRDNDADLELIRTDGYFFSITADQDSKGNIHLVFHEQGSVSGRSKIHYAIINPENIITHHESISDVNSDAINPDIYIDAEDNAHIVFMSKRVNPTYFNIDYLTISPLLVKSGLKSYTNYTAFDALNPKVAVGTDKKVRIVFESYEYNINFKNIIVLILNNGIKEASKPVTIATTYDNIMPDIDIDTANRSKIVWRSKRLGTEFGIDFCTLDELNTLSSVQSIASGSYRCHRPQIEFDYENIAHVVFGANYTDPLRENICYSYIYPNNSVSPIEDIGSSAVESYIDPNIYIYGNKAICAFLGTSQGFYAEKLLTNYALNGRFDIEVDSKARDTDWKNISTTEYLLAGTSIDTEYRISNDKIVWSMWKPISEIGADTTVGQYLHIRSTLNTTDPSITPELYGIGISYRPNHIEVQSIAKPTTKDISNVIVIARGTANITYKVSRDSGVTFTDIEVNKAVDLTTKPMGNQLVVKAIIPDGDELNAWGILW